MKHILILEDDDIYREVLKRKLSQFGRVFEARNLSEALKILEMGHLDLAFVDLDLNERFEGLKFIELAKNLKTIVLSSHEEEWVIKKAFMFGATSYLNKWKNLDELHLAILDTIGESSIDTTKIYPTNCEKLKAEITESLKLFKKSELPMLITGETGVGKSHFAKKIAGEVPFVQVNLSEFGKGTIESELFGHKKGSFTGAIEDKIGLIEKADGGILFIDEIGVLSLDIQKKLLKVIEEKEFYPVGSSKAVKSNFRLITATCDDLNELIQNKRIREDFLFRINGIELYITPIRERAEDILLFIEKLNAVALKKIFFEESAMEIIKDHYWKGNYRELNSVVSRIRSTSSGLIKASSVEDILKVVEPSLTLNHEMKSILKNSGLKTLLNSIEDLSFEWARSHCNGKVNEIVRTLGISKSLYYRISEGQKTSSAN